MTTQENAFASPALWKRVFRVLRGEGPRGVVNRVKDRWKNDFRYIGGYLVSCPIEADPARPAPPAEVQVALVSPDDPAILDELVQVYGPPYTKEMIITRWMQQELLCFLGRVRGEPVGCVWVKPEGMVVEFTRPLFCLAPEEAYFKDAMVRTEWRGRGIYPRIKTDAGQLLRAQYGKRTALSLIRYTNKPSLNASRKVGGQKVGRIVHLKLFKRKFTWMNRFQPKPL